jgi:hypothetical protein
MMGYLDLSMSENTSEEERTSWGDIFKENIISLIAFTFIVGFLAMDFLDVDEIYSTILFVTYLIIIVVYSVWKIYDMFRDGGWYSVSSGVINFLVIMGSMILIFLPIAAGITVLHMSISNALGDSYMVWIIMIIAFIVGSIVATLLMLGVGLISKMYFESRIISHFFGWSYWDEKRVEDMREDEVVENVQFDSEGVTVTVNDDSVSLDDYIYNLDERFVKYNISINYVE